MVRLKTSRILLREIQDVYVQENFYKLKLYLDDLDSQVEGLSSTVNNINTIISVPPPPAPATSAPKLIANFITDAGTAVGNIVRVNGTNTVTKITDNFSATIPNGIFGIVTNKPSSISADVIFVGIQGGYSGFTAGLPLFVSVAGVPTHTPPTTGMVQQIGFAVSSTELFLNIMQAIRRS